MKLMPKTTERVEQHTSASSLNRIDAELQHHLAFYQQHPELIPERLRALDREWDIERTLEANAAAVSLLGLVLGAKVDRRFYLLPGVVTSFLLLHAVQGWCPPLPLFRRMGVRTVAEIDTERRALREIQAGVKAASPLEAGPAPEFAETMPAAAGGAA